MRRTLKWAIAGLLLGGCEADLVPVHIVNARPGDADLVLEAAAVWGLDVEFVGFDYGAVRVELWDQVRYLGDVEVSGWTEHVRGYGCHGLGFYALRAYPGTIDPAVESIAHEFGHALGIDHAGRPERLMWKQLHTRTGMEITEDEYAYAADRVWEIRACR